MLRLEDVKRQATSKCLQKVFWLVIVFAALACVKCLEGGSQYCIPMKTLYNVTLNGGITAGDYVKIGTVENHTKCTEHCCKDSKCDLALMADNICYNLHCYSSKLCVSNPVKRSRFHVSVTYVKKGSSKASLTTILDRVSHDGKQGNSSKDNSTASLQSNSTFQKMDNQPRENGNQSHLIDSKKAQQTQNADIESKSNKQLLSKSLTSSVNKTTTKSLTSPVINASSLQGSSGEEALINNNSSQSATLSHLSDNDLSGSGSEQDKFEMLKDNAGSHADSKNGDSMKDGKTPNIQNKMVVYWKNDSQIVVKEVLSDSNITKNALKPSSISKAVRLPGEDNANQSSSFTTTPTLGPVTSGEGTSNSVGLDKNTLSSTSTNSTSFSTNKSDSDRTKVNSSIDTTIFKLHKWKLDKILSVNESHHSMLNDSQDLITDAKNVQHDNELLDKSFSHLNSSTMNNTEDKSDFKYMTNGHIVRGNSFQSKEKGTQFDLSNPLTPVGSNANMQTNSSKFSKSATMQTIQPNPLEGNTTSFVRSNSSSITKLNIMQKPDEKKCFSKGVVHNKTLTHGLHSGSFSDFGIVHNMDECVKYCCTDEACNLALMLNFTCYTLHCKSKEFCEVKSAHPSSLHPRLSFVTRITLPNIASARDRDKSKLLPSVTPQKQVSKRIKGSRCKHGSIQNDVTLKSGQKSGKFKLRPKAKDMDSCLDSCCKDTSCNLAFLIDTSCYSVRCRSHEDCAIIKKDKSSKSRSSLSVVRTKILPMNDKRQQIPKLAKKFTTVLNITNEVFSAPLADFESLEFLNMGVKVQTAISMMFASYEEYKESEVISFQPSPLITKVRMTFSDGAPVKKMLISLVKTIKAGKMESSIDGVVQTFELSTFGFQFNSPQGFNLVCDPEFNYDVHWKLTIFDYQSTSTCPRQAQGQVRRSCHGSENHNATWGSPSFVGCQTSAYKSMEQKAKSFAEGAKKKIPFKTLQDKLKTTPSEILIQIQKLTFEDTYRAMLDMSHKQTNKSLGPARKGSLSDSKHPVKSTLKPIVGTKPLFSNSTFSIPLPDSKQAPRVTSKSEPPSKSLFANGTFSIPLPDHEVKEPPKPTSVNANQTFNTRTFSRGNIPNPALSNSAPKIMNQNNKHSNIVKPPQVAMNRKKIPGNAITVPGQTRNQIPSRQKVMSALNHQPKIQQSSLNGNAKPAIVPARASQTSSTGSSYYGNVRQSSQLPRQPQTPYTIYQQNLKRLQAAQAVQAAQAKQRQLQKQQQQQQQLLQQRQQPQQQQQQLQQPKSLYQNSQVGQMWKNSQPYQQPWQSNPNWQGNQFRKGVQTGYTGYGRVPGYGYAGFRSRPESPHQKELSRKKRDLELLRVKRQGGNVVWYNGYKESRPTQRRQLNYNPTPNTNTIDLREPLLTNVQMGYDDPADSPRDGLPSSSNENYFHGPTPYYQTATYRLGANGFPTQNQNSVTGPNVQSQPDFESYPSNTISDIGSTDKVLPSQAPPAGLTPLIPSKVSQAPFGSSTNSIQYLVPTSSPPLYQTTARQTPLNQQAPSAPVTVKSSTTLSDNSQPTNPNTNLPTTSTSTRKAIAVSTAKATDSTVDVLKKKLLDMTQSHQITTTKPVLEDFKQEKNRAPMFGGDIAAAVNTLRYLSLYKKYTNPPETIDTLKQFLQVGSHILDKRNKHEWKYLTKESPDELSALDAAEIIEDYSSMVSKKLHPKDMTKPILTTNIMVVLHSVDLNTADLTKDINFPNYSDSAIHNWTDATDTLVIKPQSLVNAVKGTKVQLVSCSVRRLTDLLPKSLVSKTFGNKSIISGHVMSVSSSPTLGDVIDPPIQIVLSNNNKDVSQFEEQCVFWEKGLGNKAGKWSSRGCSFVKSNISHTICECTHMSTFSAIANTGKHKKIVAIATVPPAPPPAPEEQSNILYILLGVLAILMIVFVIMAIICLLWKRRKKQQEGNKPQRRESTRRSRARSDDNISTGSEEFDEMMASRRRNVHPDAKKGSTNSPRWQRMRKNGENPEDLMLKEKSYLLSDYHQPYHFLSANTPQPPSSAPSSSPSSSSSNRQRSRSS